MKKGFFYALFLNIFILSLSLQPQVVIRDSVNIVQHRFAIPHADQAKFPMVLKKDPATGKADTLQPIKVERHLVRKDNALSKTGKHGPVQTLSISTNYYVTFHVYYQIEGCDKVIQYDYQIPVALITHPPGSSINIDLLSADFDHPWDGVYYDFADADQIYFYEIKILPMECETHYMCQDPENPDVPIYIDVCETVDTSVPTTNTTDLGWGHFVYRITWPYSVIDVDITPPYHYEFEMPDELHHNVGVPAQLLPKDDSGNIYTGIDPMLSILLETDDAGSRLGKFVQWISGGGGLAKAGSKSSEMMSLQYTVPLYQLANGEIMYVADGENPAVPTPIKIKATDPYEISVEKTVTIIGQPDTLELNVSIPAPKEIYPTLRVLDGGNPNGRNIKGNIQLSLKKNGEPVPNQNVILTVEMILPSGGHDHTNPPDLNRRGHLRAEGASVIEGDGTVTARTNSQGSITVTYTAPEFGGRYELIATAQIEGKNLEDRDTLTVRVLDLEELPEETYYDRIGGTTEHPSNHWGTNTVIENLQSIAMAWFQRYQNEYVVTYNDISIEYGGMFDNGHWQPTHSSHRIGTDADVRTELPGLRNGIPVRTPRNVANWNITTWVGNPAFERICRTFGGTAQRHSPNSTIEHYHIDFQ